MQVTDESYSLVNTCNVFSKKGIILKPVGKYKIVKASNDEIKLQELKRFLKVLKFPPECTKECTKEGILPAPWKAQMLVNRCY